MKRSPAQIEASRRNGAMSQGPVTPEGKARSAANSVKHGLDSNVVVLSNESSEAFQALLERMVAHYQPADDVELGIVQDMVAAAWRLNRVVTLETAAIDLETGRVRVNGIPGCVSADEATKTHVAVENLIQRNSALAWYGRHETRLRRIIRDARSQLLALQSQRATPPTSTSENAESNPSSTCRPAHPKSAKTNPSPRPQ